MNLKNGLLGGIGNMLGGSPAQDAGLWTNHTTSVIGSGLSNADYDAILPQQAVLQSSGKKAAQSMLHNGDIIVRKARNGYRVIVYNSVGAEADEYIATDIEHVHDVLKLASVNQTLDAAK